MTEIFTNVEVVTRFVEGDVDPNLLKQMCLGLADKCDYYHQQLSAIEQHQKIVAGDMHQQSATWQIANTALKKYL